MKVISIVRKLFIRMIKKLCLGTAKLGMPDYGYSNTAFSLNSSDFLSESLLLGITHIDTSPRYGNSEKIIGDVLTKVISKPSVSTKIDNLIAGSKKNVNLMLHSVLSSIENLKIDRIDVCYLHQNQLDVISDKNVHEGIKLLKENNLIKEIGTSIYSESELRYTLESGVYDWVQIPVNILDTFFYDIISEYKTNIKISARSVFLQGILFDKNSIVNDIKQHYLLLEALEKVGELCSKHETNIRKLAVSYLSRLERIDQIIIGTTSIRNLKYNIISANSILSNELYFSLNLISRNKKTWTNPRYWKG